LEYTVGNRRNGVSAGAGSWEAMKFADNQVSIGDSFTKIGSWSGTVYVVASLCELPGLPTHVRLVAAGERQSAGMLMSISAVLDPRFWRRVPVATK